MLEMNLCKIFEIRVAHIPLSYRTSHTRVFSAAPTATYLPSALFNVTNTALHLPLAIMLKLPTGLYAKYCLVNPIV